MMMMENANLCTFGRKQRCIRQALFIGLAVGLHFFSCGPALGESSPPVAGITEPIADVTLSLSVPGIVSKIMVKEGDLVRKDQVLLFLDKRSEELEVARRKLMFESKAEVEGAKARSLTLKEIYESTARVFASTKSVSEEDLKKSQLEYVLADSERERLAAAESREKIEYEGAIEALAKRVLKSSIGGTVIKIYHDEGESCEEHQPLIRVVDTSRGRFVCNIDQGLGRLLDKGREVELAFGGEDVHKTGTVAFVSPVVDSASGLMEVKVDFDNEDGQVRPGASATMTFALR
jgi:RND family efflux transporter MFP subunit